MSRVHENLSRDDACREDDDADGLATRATVACLLREVEGLQGRLREAQETLGAHDAVLTQLRREAGSREQALQRQVRDLTARLTTATAELKRLRTAPPSTRPAQPQSARRPDVDRDPETSGSLLTQAKRRR